jgi:hypothetical protein
MRFQFYKQSDIQHVIICSMPKLLFLDDIRNPQDAFAYTHQEVFMEEHWEIVRSFEQFIDWIETNGLPDFVSFDHDLADVHSADYNSIKSVDEYKEKTGYDCALWMVNYCMDNRLKCPAFYCHSMNLVGRDKIFGLLEQFSRV